MSAVDTAAYNEIKQQMGEIFPDVIKTFLEFTPVKLAELVTAIDNNAPEDVFNIAHTIKSSSGSIAAGDLTDAAKNIEMLARSNTLEGVGVLLGTLNAAYKEAEDFLKRELEAY